MKDGKNHVYIKITNDEFPKIIRVRIKNWNWEYFWPYISSNDVDNILKVLKKVFGYWIWKNNFFKNKTNYNLDEYLFEWKDISPHSISPKGREVATDLWNKEELIKILYNEKIVQIKHFLKFR